MERRFKGIGNLPSYIATSTAKVFRLMAGGVVLIWLIFFLWLAIFTFFAAIVGIASEVIVAPVVVTVLFVTGHSITLSNFAGFGLGIPLTLAVIGGVVGFLFTVTEHDGTEKAMGRILKWCGNIAGIAQPAKRGYHY